MAEFKLTPKAEADLYAIWATIAIDNQAAADKLFYRIVAKLKLAANSPLVGVARPDIGPNVRLLIEGRYLVIYEPCPHGILAIAVVHGMRSPDALL